ncbi:hypothetical protein NMY22_g5468 [Coprinellus aureogranulatus]|nr:hypothetical protein NMY22_g5468 [Coprinellus aureogranulatus]
MSTQPELYIIIDERDPAFVFNGSWITSDDGPWYPEACLYGYGNFTLSFSGSSVAFIGNTGDRKATGEPFTHTVSIDGGPTYNTTFPLPDPSNVKIGQSYKQWYTSPFLPPLPFSPSPSRSSSNTSLAYNHTIMISDTHGVAVDFAIVSITDPDTPISRDQKVLVDDQDPAVRYSGSWKSTTDSQFLNFNPFPGGVPIMNSTHQAQASGDCLEFRFAGQFASTQNVDRRLRHLVPPKQRQHQNLRPSHTRRYTATPETQSSPPKPLLNGPKTGRADSGDDEGGGSKRTYAAAIGASVAALAVLLIVAGILVSSESCKMQACNQGTQEEPRGMAPSCCVDATSQDRTAARTILSDNTQPWLLLKPSQQPRFQELSQGQTGTESGAFDSSLGTSYVGGVSLVCDKAEAAGLVIRLAS